MLLRTSEAAKRLNLNKNTLEIWRVRGGGPAFCKLGKAVRYREEDLEKFIEDSIRNNTSQAAA